MNKLPLLFSFGGRISRKEYWLGITLSSFFIIIPIMIILSLMIGPIQDNLLQGASALPSELEMLGIIYHGHFLIGLLLLPMIIAFYWSFYAVTAKRFHDMNLPGWLFAYLPVSSLLPYIIPATSDVMDMVSIILPIVIGYIKGTSGTNKYGADPLALT